MVQYVPMEGQASTYPRQAELMGADLDNLVHGIKGYSVVEGLAVTAGTGLSVSVAAGTVALHSLWAVVAAASNQALTTAHATLDRIDAVVITSAGAVAIRTGTAAAAPVAPDLTVNDILLALVYVPANATSLTSTNIRDKRINGAPNGVIYEQGNQTAVTTAVTNQNAWTGVTIPANYLAAGQRFRVRAWFRLTTSATAGNLTLRVKLGTTVLATTGAVAWTVSQTDRPVLLEVDFRVVSTTALRVIGAADVNTSATAAARWPAINTANVTITSNTAQVLTVDLTTSAALTGLTPELLEIMQTV